MLVVGCTNHGSLMVHSGTQFKSQNVVMYLFSMSILSIQLTSIITCGEDLKPNLVLAPSGEMKKSALQNPVQFLFF